MTRRGHDPLDDELRASTRPAPPADPARSALLVVDMQQYFAAMAHAIIPVVAGAVRACHELGVPVVFTRHGHVDPARDGGTLAAWWGEMIIEGSAEHALLPALGAAPDDPVIAKRRYNAFHGTALEQRLRRRGVTDLAIAGVMTNLCVETTARDAFVRDFTVRVLADATATASAAMQRASLLNLAYGFAYLQSAAAWIASLRARRAR